jgi:deoxyuridine 5'-triphosphate nucleotidohydrolase
MLIDVSSIVDEDSAYKIGHSLTDSNADFVEIDPASINPQLVWHFIRGYFEGNGLSINNPRTSVYYFPRLYFQVVRAAYLEKICNYLNLPCYSFAAGRGHFILTGTNALDLLGKLYENCTVTNSNVDKYYYDWCRYCVSVFPTVTDLDIFSWCKTREDAVAPSKERVSDSGFDLTIVDVVKKFHNRTTLFTTGIKVKPAFGWYLDVVPRSSIIKSGYMLANNVGIIDRAYTGEIMIALIKVDISAPDIELPCRIAQMIPRRIAHVKFEQVDDIERTTRNEGGFGSTG